MMNTDTRQTNPVNGSFYNQIRDLFEKKQKAAILYENNGVTRDNGMITAIFEKDTLQWFTLDDRAHIRIDTLYAVNGTFSSDYSEC